MSGNSTQRYLDIAEIKEDVVVLKNGTLRAVILVSSVNFALKGEDEQNALISGYMEFVNSLDNPVEILIQSRRLDISGYIRRLKESERKQTNELLKIQINSYIEYVNELIELGEIMTKSFYVIVPYNPLGRKENSFWQRLKETIVSGQIISLKRDRFLKYRQELFLKVDNVVSYLNSLGLASAVLDTQGLIELYYNVYNPQTSENQKLKDISQIGIEQ